MTRWMLWMVLSLSAMAAHAGLSVYTSWGSLPPNPAANERTIDFNATTLASEQSAGKLTYSSVAGACTGLFICLNTSGSVSYTASTSLYGFSGNVGRLRSGTTPNPTSVKINFTQPTPYVGFLWGVQFNAQNTQFIKLTLADNSVITLKNCTSTSDAQCVGAYVPSNWLTTILNLLLGWILGDIVEYHSVYVQYQPDSGVKIKSLELITYNCANCGFLSSNTSQDFHFDYITYVDAAVAPHHLRISTASQNVAVNTDVPVTVTACGNADCSLPYINGVTGTLAMSGVGGTWSPSAGVNILAGPVNSATVNARFSSTGTATLGLSAYAPTPSNTPKVFCGMGTTPAAGNACTLNVGQALHHVRVASTATGLTCTPNSYTITACANADCSSLYTGGLTGQLSISGGTVNYPAGAGFSITAGSSSTVVQAQLTQPATYTVGLGSLSTTPSGTPQVYCGMGATPSAGGACSQAMADAGLFFEVPDHAADAAQTVSVSAVRKSDNSLACTPAFASTSKSINFKCGYTNPSTGYVAVRVGGSALNAANHAAAACDGVGQDISLAFDASGVASTTVQYADAGLMSLTASYTGSGADAGLSMTGSDAFIAVPAGFSFSAVTAGPIKAGVAFEATVTAVNSSGAKTRNFGRETSPASATLSFTKRQPTGVNSQAGSFTGSLGAFNNGEASASNLVWSEVGNADLSATSSNYLGSGLSVSGSTGSGPAGAVGPFVPDHFRVGVTQACAAGTPSFTYSGEPFGMTVTAYNALGGITYNHDGTANTSPNFAKSVTLSAATNAGLGTLGTTALPASAFAAGVASLSTQSFTFTDKLTAPATVHLRAVDSDGVSSAGHDEGAVSLRSGRLRVFNAFGSEKTALAVPLQAQYWSGKAWLINSEDDCTTVSAASVVRARTLDHRGAVTTAWSSSPAGAVTLSNGVGALLMSAPTGGATGTVELAINLGSTTTDASCLSAHPASTGLGKPWLRSINGACATTHDRDPSARATFGIYRPETQRAVYTQEVY
ncbi:DUF6701 domain-containing protein [Aquabacterium sp. A3]|uniref:DUF6701 domain-containing protein n=1 Tax=Aquabacterium sp. A3 TaxID=3132829 RepID=UPI00311A04C5